MIHIYNNLYIAMSDIEQIKHSEVVEKSRIVMIPFNAIQRGFCEAERTSENSFHPSYLTAIYKFGASISKISSLNEHKKMVFFTSRDIQSQSKLAFLLGCHLIMAHGLGFEETCLAFVPIWKMHEHICLIVRSVEKSLRAFCCARCLNWIDFGKTFKALDKKETIDVEEFEHYSRCVE